MRRHESSEGVTKVHEPLDDKCDVIPGINSIKVTI